MNNEELDEMLHQLDAAAPSDGFTTRVVERARNARRRRDILRTRGTAALLLVMAATAGGLGHIHSKRQSIAAIRSEQAAIRQELEELKQLSATASEPVIYLGSSNDIEYVVDIRDVALASTAPINNRQHNGIERSSR